ncbi:MAG: flavodoxin reductase [Bacteroidetes bacterium]|nr:flavodoxin reductase [Bacteroidota bacterium]
MEKHLVKIESIQFITHDVLQIETEKPRHYSFNPGQATEISINKDGWLNERRPFTFTCLPLNDFLQFTIKTYPEHKGVTNELRKLKKNDTLIVHEVFGAIAYREEGLFIAGGAGITPFICIFRDLRFRDKIGHNKLIFANKTKDDIILMDELKHLLGENFINILSEEKKTGFLHGFITREILKANLPGRKKNIYVCGPPPMMDAVTELLAILKVDEKLIIQEAV